MNIFSAPPRTFYDAAFYRQAPQTRLGKGFSYLFYLIAIATVLITLFFSFQVLPRIDRFANWTASELPELIWTPEGVIMNAESPYTLVHPLWGPVMMIDTSRDYLQPEDRVDAPVFLTAKALYVLPGAEEGSVYNLTRDPRDIAPESITFMLDEAFLLSRYQAIRPFLGTFIFVFSFLVLTLMKMIEALLFSLVGMLWNLKRVRPLDYRQILLVTFFAMTPAFLIQMRGFFLPVLNRIPFGPLGSILVTAGYLYFALIRTEESPAPPDAQPAAS